MLWIPIVPMTSGYVPIGLATKWSLAVADLVEVTRGELSLRIP